MGKIIKPDPYLSAYVYEKQTNPSAPIVWRQFEKSAVEDVDHLVELAQGSRQTVTTDKDWQVVEEILKFYYRRWPYEYNEFVNSVKEIRETRKKSGYSSSKEILYVGALPPRFERIVKTIFPLQQFNKKFIWKMVRKFKIFKVGGEGN